MTAARVRGRRTATLLVAGALALGGCAADPVDLSSDAAARLQEAVWAVTSAAAQGRHDAAVGALARVRSELDLAVEDGEISVQRYREVDAALRAAETELAAAQEAAAAALPDDGEPQAAEPEETEPDSTEQPVEAPAPAPPPVAPVVPVDPAPPAEPSGPQKDTKDGNQGNGVGPDGNRGRGGGQGNGQGRAPGQGRGAAVGRD